MSIFFQKDAFPFCSEDNEKFPQGFKKLFLPNFIYPIQRNALPKQLEWLEIGETKNRANEFIHIVFPETSIETLCLRRKARETSEQMEKTSWLNQLQKSELMNYVDLKIRW